MSPEKVEYGYRTRFENLLSESGSLPWLMMFGVGPIVLPKIPLGIYYTFTHPHELKEISDRRDGTPHHPGDK